MSDNASKHGAPTIWTAAATSDVPLLAKLDMQAPPSGAAAAKERAAVAKQKLRAAQAAFRARSTAESLRKLVK